MTDMEKIKELKRQLEEAKQTALIAKDLKSKYELSLLVLVLRDLGELNESEVMQIRKQYGLTSMAWMVAESALLITDAILKQEDEKNV